MNNILNGRFISALTPDANPTNNLSEYYAKFKEEVILFCESNTNFATKFRSLRELHTIIKFQTNFSTEDLYIQRALGLVDSELELIEKAITHPELLVKEGKTIKSSLYWSNKYPKRCLIELLAALHSSGAIVDASNKPSEFQTLTKSISNLLNINISFAYKERERLLARAGKLTFFLDTLKKHLIDKSQKIDKL